MQDLGVRVHLAHRSKVGCGMADNHQLLEACDLW
jgi:hypothetical protein